MQKNYTLGKLFGISVQIHYTWFLVFLLMVWSLSTEFFPINYPGMKSSYYVVISIVSALMLFISVLLHELSHSLTARRFKIKVGMITLFFFGGIAHISDDKLTAKSEFWMAIAGPAFSILFALLSWILFKLVMVFDFVFLEGGSIVLFFLFRLNLMLGIFNMFPGFPLDGGRVFRSIIWWVSGDLERATKYASKGGRIFAYILIGLGILEIVLLGSFGGLWFIVLGLFLRSIANQSYQQVLVKKVLEKLKIKDIMKTKFDYLVPEMNLSDVARKIARKSSIYYLVLEKKKLVGVLDINTFSNVKKKERKKTLVKDVMIRPEQTKGLHKDMNAFGSMTLLLKKNYLFIPVINKKAELVGIIEKRYVLDLIQGQLDLKK
ncbi:site-2 protease family protein [Candidatus Woesearchaeota archaeon]|jgi:Zn-dependent protease|nr:site-2 protease family protein [Candidatus Woesearchaeota archaeon]MBT6520434.1 site-2 protease family protein [Candidatus Woesearchaeota archaeon]MBT7367360.1 site-2 protease family protein [Candidatus Woesearchaeota archaeon]